MESYFDKRGFAIGLFEWCRLFEDKNYCRVNGTILWWGGYVSTVWIGLDHSFGEGEKAIFESMVFGHRCNGELDQVRYPSLERAESGHRHLVKKWSHPMNVLRFLWTIISRTRHDAMIRRTMENRRRRPCCPECGGRHDERVANGMKCARCAY